MSARLRAGIDPAKAKVQSLYQEQGLARVPAARLTPGVPGSTHPGGEKLNVVFDEQERQIAVNLNAARSTADQITRQANATAEAAQHEVRIARRAAFFRVALELVGNVPELLCLPAELPEPTEEPLPHPLKSGCAQKLAELKTLAAAQGVELNVGGLWLIALAAHHTGTKGGWPDYFAEKLSGESGPTPIDDPIQYLRSAVSAIVGGSPMAQSESDKLDAVFKRGAFGKTGPILSPVQMLRIALHQVNTAFQVVLEGAPHTETVISKAELAEAFGRVFDPSGQPRTVQAVAPSVAPLPAPAPDAPPAKRRARAK
jgi:hypothetical protein